MKFTGSKVKLSRQLGIALTPKAAKIMERKGYPPGQHGQTRRRMKPSDYRIQLLEKQKLRAQYNIHERQMRNYVQKATRKSGDTSENLIRLLEMRLDAVVLRGGLAKTIYAARQYVNHRHVQVNGRTVNIPSYGVKVGDIISVRSKSRKLEIFQQSMRRAAPPPYLALSKPEAAVTVLVMPQRDDIPIVCELSLVVEFYSR